MDVLRMGMIGLGGIGTYAHYPGYAEIPEKVRVVALCDKNPANVNELAGKIGAEKYDDFQELLKNPDVDAVDICLPHFLHGQVAIAALKAKKHVVVEKPMAMSLDDAQEMISLAKKNGLKLMVAENTRFVKAYEVAKSILDKGQIGEVTMARTYIGGSEVRRYSDPDSWVGKSAKSGGGVLFDAGVHSFYLLRWFLGDVRGVKATVSRFLKDLPSDAEDNATGTLRFANDALASFSLTDTTESPWTERLELFGTKGSLIVDMLAERPIQLFSTKNKSDDMSEWWSWYGDVSWQEPYISHSAMEWKLVSIRNEVKHFVDSVRENSEPLVTGEDGKKAIEVAFRAYEAAKSGKEVLL